MARSVEYAQVVETKLHRFVGEASDLGLAPGEWPPQISTTMGNGMPFIRVAKKLDPEGELMYVRYHQANGCIDLLVYND